MPEKRRKGGGSAASPDDASFNRNTSWTSIVAVNILMIFVGVFVASLLPWPDGQTLVQYSLGEENNVVKVLGLKGALLYRSLDTNQDGNISYAEFGPIVEKLTGQLPPVLVHQKVDRNSGDAVTLLTDFIPLVFESMKTYEDEGMDGMMRNYQALTGLRSWNQASVSEMTFFSQEFHNFLPKAGDEEPGKAYWLYKPDLEPWYQGESGKYFPPNPEVGEEILFKLMRMFHSRPFLLTRFGPYGSAAIVQADNEHFYHIRFRIHCEFQVNEPPRLPFWVTPAQFYGNLVISKDGGSVQHFSLQLPTDRLLNMDMEWITKLANEETGDGQSMEVEIAYQPRMAIIMSGGRELNSFSWTRYITEQDAASALEKAFYPFKEVTYHTFEDNFKKAAESSKLVHNIVLWGSLDDQSC